MSIKIFTGPMKSGKSDDMLGEIKRKKKYAKKNVVLIKVDPKREFGEDISESRNNKKEDCFIIPAHNPEYIYSLIDNSTDVIAIDEAQFFKSEKIVDIVQDLNDKGYEILIAGLDMNSDRKPYKYMPQLMAIAHTIDRKQAVCEFCNSEDARYSLATFEKMEEDIVSQDDTAYKACCHKCYLKYKK